jgi:hypothetical protein
MLDPSQLHVFTARSNPLYWDSTHRNWQAFARGMLAAGVTLTVIDCAFGEEDHLCAMDGVRHIPVRAKTRVWNKENLLNIGVHRTPEAQYIAWMHRNFPKMLKSRDRFSLEAKDTLVVH